LAGGRSVIPPLLICCAGSPIGVIRALAVLFPLSVRLIGGSMKPRPGDCGVVPKFQTRASRQELTWPIDAPRRGCRPSISDLALSRFRGYWRNVPSPMFGIVGILIGSLPPQSIEAGKTRGQFAMVPVSDRRRSTGDADGCGSSIFPVPARV
jgi:hypothetical protein